MTYIDGRCIKSLLTWEMHQFNAVSKVYGMFIHFYSLLGWSFFRTNDQKYPSLPWRQQKHQPPANSLWPLGGASLPTTGANVSEIQVAPFSQGAWSHFETDPFKILADWCGRAWEFLENTHPLGVCYSKNEALTVSIPKEKIWKATFFGNNILCWESPLKNISDQGISSFEKSREAR